MSRLAYIIGTSEKDARALAAAIEGLLREPERRRALAARARAVVHDRFDRRHNIAQLVEIFAAHGGPHPEHELHDARTR